MDMYMDTYMSMYSIPRYIYTEGDGLTSNDNIVKRPARHVIDPEFGIGRRKGPHGLSWARLAGF